MRDTSFTLEAGLFTPAAPFSYRHGPRPGVWFITDANGVQVARSKTRAGARLAVRALYREATDQQLRLAA
jgi:hypothetical protein